MKSTSTKIIWAPWRMEYIKKINKKDCFLCKAIREKKDSKNFVILRSKHCIGVLNIYPYNNGHLMIAPLRHISSFEKLTSHETNEMLAHTKKMIQILKKILKPEGFNLGLNIGKSAGAGVKGHLHLHIVPRWVGDTNFMPVLSNTKVIPQALKNVYKKIKKVLNA